jgi:hypothetical protein
MKPSQGQRKCRHCHHSYLPDYRNRYHQRYCSLRECQQASKRASQRQWLKREANRNYFSGPEHVSRVQKWRGINPHYWKTCSPRRLCRGRAETNAHVAAPDQIVVPGGALAGGTLQDFCRVRTPLLLRLVSQLERGTLQEDIARCASSLVSVGQCILERTNGTQKPPANAYELQPDLPFEPNPAILRSEHRDLVGSGPSPPPRPELTLN